MQSQILRIAAIAFFLFYPNPEKLVVKIVTGIGLASVLEHAWLAHTPKRTRQRTAIYKDGHGRNVDKYSVSKKVL